LCSQSFFHAFDVYKKNAGTPKKNLSLIRRLTKSVKTEERTERRGEKSSQSSQGARRGIDSRMLGTRKKKPLNKRIRSSSSDSEMDQDQQRMRKTRKKK
jgi:hypothetical protein